MIRFTMPDPGLGPAGQAENIRLQLDHFKDSDALRALLELLHADRNTLGSLYNGRLCSGGRIVETQTIGSSESLEPYRYELYDLLKELGSFDICEARRSDHSRIIILGGSLNACFVRTEYAAGLVSGATVSVDGLTCYRPVNPVEHSRSSYICSAETEFGAMAEAFTRCFGAVAFAEEFEGNRNLNSISCIRRYACEPESFSCNLYAAPSGEPEIRRADTGDTLDFYLNRSDISADDKLLFITNNRYCNRQFIQLAYQLIKSRRRVYFDIIGTTPSNAVITPEAYDPLQYIQDVIGILDWIRRFELLTV